MKRLTLITGVGAEEGGTTPSQYMLLCAAPWGRGFGTPDLERGIHIRVVFQNGFDIQCKRSKASIFQQ